MNLLPNTNKMKFCFVSILMLLLVSAGFSQPIGTITSVAPSPTNQNPIPITIEFNAEVVDFIDTDIVVSGGTIGNFSTADNIVFTFDLTPFSDGVCTVDIPADVCTDVSLNPNVASTQFSIEYDGTAPVLNTVTIVSDNVNSGYAKVGDDVTLTFTSSETLVVTSVVINGNIVTPVEGLPNEWTATYVATEGDAEGIVPFTIDFTDVAGNTGVTVSTTTDASQVIFDKTPAVLTTVNLASNNANPTYAKVGDVVILSFTSSDSIENVASTIFGNSANINYFGSNNWEATYTTTGSEIEGVAPFAIDFTDVAGNVGATVTATTDASQVTFDNTVPGGYTVSFDQADINATNQTECSFTIDGAEIDATLNYTISSTGGGTDINGSGTITTSSQSFSPIDVSGLGDGTLTLTITLTDLAGNVGVEEFSTVIKYTLSPSLVAYYPFNNNAIDESGNGYNGNPVGPTLVEDRFNNPNSAFNFTGLNDVIDITIDKTLFINGDFTTNSWINISDADFDYIISGDLAHTMVGGGSQTTKSIICHFYNGIDWPTYYSDVDIPVNTWTMVTLIRRGQEIEFYINGKPRGVFTESAIGGVSFISLGGDGSDVNRTLEGMLDDVRIYSYALPEEEITTLYHEGGWDMVADIDGNLYPIVQIGSQEWMGKNLRTAKYSNGETISRVVDNATWTGLTTEAYCWYNNDSTTYSDIYGAIYNWHAANDPRGICPIGWHVPTDAEWTILTNFVGGENIAGNVLKATSGWFDNGNGIDQYGFSALPGGYRESSDGVAYGVGSSGWWWTSTESNATFAWRRAIDFGNISVDRFDVDMKNGFSVRCIKDKEEFAGGTGIPGDPYLVSTADHLYNVRNYPSASFLQVGDIYLNEWPWNQGEGWQPIGDNATPFAGIYDGNGHGIFNLFIDRYDYDYQGLFGFAQNATIKNVNLYDIWIRIQNSGNSHGSLVGYNEASYILNCHAVGYIQGVNHVGGLVGRSTVGGARIEGSSAHLSSNGTGEYIGGLVGFNDNNAVIDSCFSAGDVSATYYGGGLVGWNGGAAYIYNSYSVSNTYGYQVSGGFVGHNDGTIEHSYSAGKISGSTGLGGFTGEDTFMGTISNCFWNTETSQIETSASGTGKVSAEMKTQSTFTGWGFPNPWEILEGETYPYLAWQGGPQDFNYPPVLYTVTFNVDMTGATFDPVNDIVYITGSMFGDPWPEPGTDPVNQEMTRVDATMIWTKTLQIYNGYYGYKYFLNSGWDNSEWGGEPNRNIEIQSDTTFNNSWASLFPDEFAGGSGNASSPLLVETVEQLNNVRNHPDLYFLQIANIDLGVSPWNESEGWLPIGEESNVFSGGYDGNGFVISNLFINRLADYQGLFGYISNANLNSIAVETANITGNDHVGGIVGSCENSKLKNSYVSGSISGVNRVGGIAGTGGGSSTFIRNCYSLATVSGTGDIIGGLIGANEYETTIKSSYATGGVTGNYMVGGLLGMNGGGSKLYDSYAMGNVDGNESVGGLVGYNGGDVYSSYSTGSVSGTTSIGGLVGENYATVSGSYWDTETSLQAASAGGEGRLSAEMKYPYDASTFIDWDFTSIWVGDTLSTNNQGYPYLSMAFSKPVVTFNLDMSLAGDFNPDVDVVYITGSMFSWAVPGTEPENQTMQRVDESMIWTKTLELDEGDYQYKYFINDGWSLGDPVDNRDVLITDNVVFNDTWDYSPATHGYPISLIIEPVGLSVELYGGGNRLADETAQIVAGAAFGYEFDQWLGTPEDIALLDNPYSPSANFVMPPREVSFTANYIAATGYDLLFTITDETPEPLEMVEVNLRYRGTGGKTKDTSSRKNSVERQLVNDPVSNNVEPAAITESVFEESLMLDDKGMVVDVLPDKKVGRSESKNSKSCAFNYDMFVGAVRIITDSNEEVISKTDYLAGLPTDYGFDMPGGGTAVNLYGLVIYDLFFPGSQVKVWVNKDYSWLYVPNQTILDSWESYGAVYLENTYNEFVDFCGYEISFNTTPTVNAGHYGDHNFRILPYGLTTIYTDPSGLASVNTPGGDYFYSVRLPGYQSQSSNTTLSTSTNIPVTLVEIFEGGTGAIDDPFLIATAEQLNSVRDFTGYEYVDVYFKQIADINLGVSPWIDAEGWDPIGYQSSPFTAKYNGNYHSITGLTINRPEQQQVGLFGWVSSATLKNLAVSNVNVNGSWRVGALAGHIEGNTIVDSVSTAGAISGSVHVGGLVGRVWDSSVSNSYSQVNVTQVVGDVTQQAAGLVGRLYNGSIQSCFATGNVSGAPTGYWNGGLVSVNSAGSSISNSYSTGDVSGYLYLGGLVAAIQDTSSIVNCYSVSYVADSLNSGGLVGIAYDDIYVIENSYWNYETSCQSKSGAGEGKSTIEMITQTTFSAWDFANVWNITDGVTYPYLRHQSEIGTFNYPIELIPPTNLTVIGGNGSVSLSWNAPSYGTPTGYKIYRDGSLVYTASNAELSYNDVGLTNFVYYTYYITAVYAGGESNPTVSQTTFPNTGFDGGDGSELNPFVISNADQLHTVRLYPSSHFVQVADIDLGTAPWNENEGWDPIGNDEELFTGTYDGGGYSVSNLTINRPDGIRMGLFGNAENAMFSNIHLENIDIVGLSQLGSIVGHAYTCSIDTCSASGSINAEGTTIGGIAGFIGEFSSLTQSYSDVKIIAKYNSVGGLVGVSLNSSIADSYSAGYIGAEGYVGGLVGYCQDQASVTNCYSVGFVAGVNEVGGLVGSADAPELIVNGFWDIPSSGQYDSPAGTGLFTNDMLLQSNFTGWDFSTIWSINEGVTYPYLQWQISAGSHNNPTDNYSDIDGNTYSTIVIGEQEWFAENLKVTRFQNGAEILNGEVLGGMLPDTSYYFAYDNNTDNIVTYGLLYTGYTVVNPSYNVCPAGWAVPTNEQWKVMEMQLGMSWEEANNWGISNGHGTDEGGKLKATGLDYWALPNVGATNEIGFSALPGGGRYISYSDQGTAAKFFTSSDYGGSPILRIYSFNHPRTFKSSQDNGAANSIRCIKIRYDQSEPQVVTGSITSVQASTATIDAEVVDAGNATVVARGIAYSRYTDMPEVETQVGGMFTSNGVGVGTFSAEIKGLLPGINYYARAYAVNAKGISFGETVEFTTQPAALPNVSYPVVDSIKQTSIYLHAEVYDIGDSDVTARGFVWSTSDYPISDNNKIFVGSGLGVFEGVIEGLTPNTLYFLRSFATNSSGTFYSNKIYQFTATNTPLPSLSEPLVENITSSSSTVAATITDDGGYSILDKGVKYSWPDGSEEISLGSGLGEINISLTDLLPSTSYTIQAYATNENGKAYGPQVSFTTRFNTYEEALAYLDYHAYPLLHIIAVGEGNHSDFGVKSFDIISDLMGNDMVLHSSSYGWFFNNYNYTFHLMKSAKTTMDVWKRLYLLVDQVNFVIDNIDLATGPIEEKNSIKAQAYSLRAFAHFYLVQLFSPAYSNNSNAPGIPYITGGGKGSIPPVISFNNEGSASELQQYVDEIVLYNSENVSKNQKSGSAILQRGTVSDVYNQLQIDLDNAITLFQSGVARVNIQHVDLSVAHGLRARVALAMEDWINASENADAAILAAETDGKALYITSNYNSDGFNSVFGSEWMWGTEKTEENATMYASFFSHMDATVMSYAQLGLQKKITLDLYNSFPASDVRKSLFIEPGTGSEPLVDLNQMKFIDQGGFTGDYLYMRLSEMYLIKAEALAHQVDQYANAQSTLYSLVSQRDNSYVQSTNTAEALVDEVLLHRRMELWGEGYGFTDLKRLQKPLNRPIGVGNHDLAICYVANVTANSDSMVWRIPYHSYLDITINGEGNVDVEGQPYVSPLLIADNSTVILQASPVDLFAGWSVDGEPVSVDPIFELNILNTDVVVTADFVVKYELLLASNPNDIGATITGAGSYEEGLPVTIVADDVPGFQFTGWTGTPDDLALLSSTSEATATFTMPPRAVSYVANYTPVDYTFSTLINPEAYGSVTVSPIQDYYHVGDSITVTASPVEDYEFDNWTEGVTPVSVDTVYKFAMPPRDLVLTANFKLSEYKLSVVVAPTASGTVTKDPLKEFYNAGNTVNLTAVPTQGYRFLKWTEAGTTISTSPNYEVVMPSRDVYLTANFEATPQRTLSLIVNPEDAGTVTGAGTFYEGAEVVVTATPNPGYLFVGWKQANVLVSELPDYVFNIPTTNITLTAQFEVELDPVNQTILLAEGWNIFSTYLTLENASMMNIVQPLITENILVKVQDQTGNSIEKVGEQWIDNIGDLDLNQGYKVKVTQDTAITLSGVYEGGGMSWSFVTGWNLGGFTSNLPVNATVAFSDAVNEEALQKAQSQTGAAYEKLPAFGWVNRIGNLKPGEGYRVRVSKDWTTPNALSSIAPEQFENCVFKPVWGGYGYDHHNIFIQSATLNGYTLPAGTQIGVFDGDRCVGVTIVDEKTSFPINLVAVQDDPFTTEIDGFISGNDFEIKLWDNQSRSFVAHIEFYQYGENEMKFKPGGTTVVDLRAATTVTDVNTETFAHGLGQIFPNPTKNSTTISFSLNRTDEVRIRVFNLLGECVSTLVNKKFYRGHHQVEWNPVKEKLPPGIYLIRMEVNNLVQTSKVVFSH